MAKEKIFANKIEKKINNNCYKHILNINITTNNLWL